MWRGKFFGVRADEDKRVVSHWARGRGRVRTGVFVSFLFLSCTFLLEYLFSTLEREFKNNSLPHGFSEQGFSDQRNHVVKNSFWISSTVHQTSLVLLVNFNTKTNLWFTQVSSINFITPDLPPTHCVCERLQSPLYLSVLHKSDTYSFLTPYPSHHQVSGYHDNTSPDELKIIVFSPCVLHYVTEVLRLPTSWRLEGVVNCPFQTRVPKVLTNTFSTVDLTCRKWERWNYPQYTVSKEVKVSVDEPATKYRFLSLYLVRFLTTPSTMWHVWSFPRQERNPFSGFK